MYDYMNIQRKNKEDIVNLVHAANGSKFYISNASGSHVMMINENGAYMERMAGKNPALEFCDRRDPRLRYSFFVATQLLHKHHLCRASAITRAASRRRGEGAEPSKAKPRDRKSVV